MVLMLLVGTSSAWAATIYLDANYNGNNWTSSSANIWACNGSINPGTPSGSNYVQGTKVADGIYKINGHSGCNQFFGQYKAADGKIKFMEVY